MAQHRGCSSFYTLTQRNMVQRIKPRLMTTSLPMFYNEQLLHFKARFACFLRMSLTRIGRKDNIILSSSWNSSLPVSVLLFVASHMCLFGWFLLDPWCHGNWQLCQTAHISRSAACLVWKNWHLEQCILSLNQTHYMKYFCGCSISSMYFSLNS